MPLATPQRAAAGQTLQYRCASVGQLPLPPAPSLALVSSLGRFPCLCQLPSGPSEKLAEVSREPSGRFVP